ncbi:antibiotic transporter permease [Lactobacillus melliventris]|uniref:Antibiotic transporter permease n=1 Tax=Lactobacillus melliventris TaxID=1218507 RepID=A0ABX5N0U1_9LACO|nr:antibiotic transporter permease [Lactobacillus melliventris]PXY84318.1 antibiotic transporter permease [Lactobacillus melliventris]
MFATQFSSLSFLNNWRTKLTYFFITPMINLVLLVLINMQFSNQFNWDVAISSIAIDAAVLTLETFCSAVITDANLKIDFELIAKRPFSFRYWLAKCIVAIIIGCTLALINLFLLYLLGAPLDIIGRALLMLPLLCLYGCALGFVSWAISWQMNDPYFLENIFSSLAQLISGVLVVISAYPDWLKAIALLFPFAEPVTYIKTGGAKLAYSVFITLIWLVIGIFAYIIQIKPVLAKGKHHY